MDLAIAIVAGSFLLYYLIPWAGDWITTIWGVGHLGFCEHNPYYYSKYHWKMVTVDLLSFISIITCAFLVPLMEVFIVPLSWLSCIVGSAHWSGFLHNIKELWNHYHGKPGGFVKEIIRRMKRRVSKKDDRET